MHHRGCTIPASTAFEFHPRRGRMPYRYQTRTWCLLLAAAGFACAGAKPYQTTFNAPVLHSRETPEGTKDEVTIPAVPITLANILQFPELARMVRCTEPDP